MTGIISDPEILKTLSECLGQQVTIARWRGDMIECVCKLDMANCYFVPPYVIEPPAWKILDCYIKPLPPALPPAQE